MHTLNQNQQEHDAVLELLPWHLNNTLNAEESERVLAHLQQCAACQQEAELLTAALDAADTYAPAASIAEDGFETVMARIDQAEALENTAQADIPRTGLSKKLSTLWHDISANSGFSVGWGAAATAGLLVAVIGFQFLPPNDAPEYKVFTSAPTGNESPVALRVQFKSAMTPAEAQKLLEISGVELTLQQEDAINYIVGLPNDAPLTALNTLLRTLSAETEIANVEVALEADK